MRAVPATFLLFSSIGLFVSIVQAADVALVALPEEDSVSPMRALALELSTRGFSAVVHMPGGLGTRTDEEFEPPKRAAGTHSTYKPSAEGTANSGVFTAGVRLPCSGCWEVFDDVNLELHAAGFLNRSAFHSSPTGSIAAESTTGQDSLHRPELSLLFPHPLKRHSLVPQQHLQRPVARATQTSTQADDDATVGGNKRHSDAGTREMATPAPVHGWGAAEVARFISFHAGAPVSTAACALAGLNGRSIISAQQAASKSVVSGKSSPKVGHIGGTVLTAAILVEVGVTSSRAQSKVLKALSAVSSAAAAAEARGALEAEQWCMLLEKSAGLNADHHCNNTEHGFLDDEANTKSSEDGSSNEPGRGSCSSSGGGSGGGSSGVTSSNDCRDDGKKERLGVFQLLWKVLRAGALRLMSALMEWFNSVIGGNETWMHATGDGQLDSVAEYEAWLAYVDQFEDIMLEPLLTAWTSKRPSLVVCDRWCYACLDAAELLDLPLVVYNTGLLNHLEDISTFAHPSSLRVKEKSDAQVAKAPWRPSAVLRFTAHLKAWESKLRSRLSANRYARARDARRARLGLGSVAARDSLMSGGGLYSVPHHARHYSSRSSSSRLKKESQSAAKRTIPSTSAYRALAVMGGSVLGIERPQSLPPAVHLTGPLLFSDLSCNSRPCTNRSGKGRRAQLPSSLLRWVEGSDRSHPTLDSTWVAHPITNDSNVTNDTSNNNDNINNAKNYTTKNHTPSSWAVRPAPVVVVDLGPHWASNAQMSQAAWTHAGREALELLQGLGLVNSTGQIAKHRPGPPTDLRVADILVYEAMSNAGEGQTPRRQLHQQFSALAANAGLTFRVVWLLPEDQWGLLPREVLQTANAPGSKLMLVSPLGADGVRASNGKLDALLDHGNVAALVASGGVERTHRALVHRKPLLLLPRSSTDRELARKLTTLRAAVTIGNKEFQRDEVSQPHLWNWSDSINESLWRLLLDPEVPSAVASMSEVVRSGGGVQRAVNLIEQALLLTISEDDESNQSHGRTNTNTSRIISSLLDPRHATATSIASSGSASAPSHDTSKKLPDNDLTAACAAAGLTNDHNHESPSAGRASAASSYSFGTGVHMVAGREWFNLLSTIAKSSSNLEWFPLDVLMAHALVAMVALLSGKFLIKVFLKTFKRAARLLVRKLGISPSLYSKSGARNRDANSQRGQANVINGFVGADDELENAEDDEVEWTGLLLALAAVPLALVTCACRAFGRFVVSWIGVPLLDFLLGPADVSLDAHPPPGLSSLGAPYQSTTSGPDINNAIDGASNASSSSSGGAISSCKSSSDGIIHHGNTGTSSTSSSTSSSSANSGSRSGRRRRERAAVAQPSYGFPSVEGELAPGLILPPQPLGMTRLIFGAGVSFGIYVLHLPGRGLSITHVEPGYGLGVATGDLLVEINGEPIVPGTPELDVTTRLQSLPRPVVLGFSRRGLDFTSALREEDVNVPGI